MTAESRGSYLQRAGVPFLAGVPGILALVASIYLTYPEAAVPPGMSLPVLAAVSAITPLLLLGIACLLGAFAAPRVGLRSYLIERVTAGQAIWPRLRPELPRAIGLGVAGGVGVLVLDAAFSPFIARELPDTAVAGGQPDLAAVLVGLPVRFLYGGITEELLLRFGLMSLLAFGLWALTGRRGHGPSSTVMWAAVVIAALLFGAGHLPALAQSVGLTPLLVVRTILLNALLGTVFGWLYWRHSLEAAVAAHMGAHVPLGLVAIVQVLLL